MNSTRFEEFIHLLCGDLCTLANGFRRSRTQVNMVKSPTGAQDGRVDDQKRVAVQSVKSSPNEQTAFARFVEYSKFSQQAMLSRLAVFL